MLSLVNLCEAGYGLIEEKEEKKERKKERSGCVCERVEGMGGEWKEGCMCSDYPN